MTSPDDERLEELAELAEAGLAAAGLAHELRQPLFALRALGQLGQAGRGLDGPAVDDLIAVVDHLEGLLAAWGEVGRREEPRLYDASEVVSTVGRLLVGRARLLGARLDVRAPVAVWAVGSPSAARQVTLNLVQNALDAVSDASVRAVSVQAVVHGARVGVEVRDSGPGIPDADRARLFEPFFTTKGSGGTGLGLWVARRLCEASGGTLEIAGTPDGTLARGQFASAP